MLKNFDHLTIVVRDVERAKAFFAVLGFKEAQSVVIAGEPFAGYMGVPGIKADHLYCDMNGEPYRADEFGFATIRAGALFRDPSAFTAPADCWGDVGAASGPMFLVLADAATRKGYAPGPVLAAFMSSESGERCGFVTRGRVAQGVR